MSKPIPFDGTEYASVEAMPPDVRAAYEELKGAMDEALGEIGIDETGAALPGGPRTPGGKLVPVEFQQVTSLGPVEEVYAHNGTKILLNFGTPRVYAMVRYRDGLAYQTGGKDIHLLRWDEVAVIQSNITRQHSAHSEWTQHECTLTKLSGETLILDEGLDLMGDALFWIRASVVALMGPRLGQRYQAGEALTFGPVTVQRQNGLQLDGKLYAWDAIQDMKVESGRFKMTQRDGKKREARASAIPNIELLCQVIGVQLQIPELAYH
jgi:hypothetical protein